MNSASSADKSLAGLNDFVMELQAPGKGVAEQMRERRKTEHAGGYWGRGRGQDAGVTCLE